MSETKIYNILGEYLCDFSEDLRVANLYKANLNEANLCGADLREANLYRANLYEANLHGADLRRANLNGANLNGANLNGANLNGANLCGADLNGAYLNGANLYKANLNGAKRDGNTLNKFIQIVGVAEWGTAFAYSTDDGRLIFEVGCQHHTPQSAREYWSGKLNRVKTLLALEMAELWFGGL